MGNSNNRQIEESGMQPQLRSPEATLNITKSSGSNPANKQNKQKTSRFRKFMCIDLTTKCGCDCFKQEKIVLTEKQDQDAFAYKQWINIDYQQIVDQAWEAIQLNQSDVAKGIDLNDIRKLRRVHKQLEPYEYFAYESRSFTDATTQFDYGKVETVSQQSHGESQSQNSMQKNLQQKCIQNGFLEMPENNPQNILINQYIMLQEDVAVLKKYLEKLYEKNIVALGEKRQAYWDRMAEQRQKSAWTAKCNLKKQRKKLRRKSGDQYRKMKPEVDKLKQLSRQLEDIKLDTMIVQTQHQNYMSQEKQRYETFMQHLDALVDMNQYEQMINQQN